MTLTAHIDESACAGHGDCAVVAPDAFAVDGGIARVVGPAADDDLRAAAEACPSVAILLVDDSGAQIYP
jgi:ferredoxin